MIKINNLMFRSFLVFIALITFTACGKNDKFHEQNIELIEQYLVDNNLTAQRTETDLYYIITEEGDGNFPTVANDVTVNYTGYLTNKNIFDQGLNATFPLANVIKGWQEGIPKISRGGSAILIIPARLGYGTQATTSIPGNSVLIFEVDLLGF